MWPIPRCGCMCTPTKSGKAYVAEQRKLGVQPREIKTGDIVTAKGYLAPLSHISGVSEIVITPDLYRKYVIRNELPTGIKGTLAVEIVGGLLKKNLIPLPVQFKTIDDLVLQLKGTDIFINSSLHLQVKCDWRAGRKEYGGTGNLFLQTDECNPYKQFSETVP